MIKEDAKDMMDDIDELIVSTLGQKDEPMSTYKIAKQTGLSWSTINTHCYKLKSLHVIDGRLEAAKIGQRKKLLWWVDKKEDQESS